MKSANLPATVGPSEKPLDLGHLYVADADCLPGLPLVVRQIAACFDGRRTAKQVARQARISEAKCRAVIRKLTALGALRPAPRPTGDPPMTAARAPAPARRVTPHAFSELEESFFATEVEVIDECDEPFVGLGERVRAALCELVVRLRGPRGLL